MPAIPLGRESYKRSAGFQPEVELVNMYIEEDKSGASPDNIMRIQRPGLVAFNDVGSATRGMYQKQGVQNGAIFIAAGSAIYSLATGSPVSIGTIDNDGLPVEFAGTFEKLFAISVATVYAYDGATLTALTIPDGRIPTTIDTLNGYLIVGCTDGRFYWLVPGAATIDALDFANAESSPDGLVAVRRLIDEMWMQGGESTEVWQATGDLDAPFQKAGGRQYERGCLARETSRRFDNALRWVGNDALVYSSQSVPTEGGGDAMSERLQNRTGEPSAWTFGVARHKFYALRIPGQGTWGYDPSTDQWTEFESTDSTTWRPHVGVSLDDVTYCGDSDSGKIWRMDTTVANDDGAVMRRAVSGTLPNMSRPYRDDSLSVGVGASADCTLKVRWKDGRDDYPAFFEELEVRAPVDVVSMYRLGSIEPPFRTFQLEVTDDVIVRISGAMFGEAWQ